MIICKQTVAATLFAGCRLDCLRVRTGDLSAQSQLCLAERLVVTTCAVVRAHKSCFLTGALWRTHGWWHAHLRLACLERLALVWAVVGAGHVAVVRAHPVCSTHGDRTDPRFVGGVGVVVERD